MNSWPITRPSSHHFCRGVLLLLITLTLAACSSEPSKVAVSGTVTYDNQPVEDGQVAFEPVAGGKMQFGIIADGRYAIPKQYGLVPGEYIVRITASRPTGKLAETDAFLTEETSLEINEQFLPSKYNSASTLTVDIADADQVTHDFALSR